MFKFDTDRLAKPGNRRITGPLISGRAWMDGGSYGCDKADGVGCGLVEFTLVNNPGFGSVNYSLQAPGGHSHV